MRMKPRLLLVEDHELVPQGLEALLAPEFDIVDMLPDGEGASSTVDRLAPDVLLLDLSLPKRGGRLFLADFVVCQPTLPIIILTQHVDPLLADLALERGALGYVVKESGLAELRTAVHEVLAGRQFVSPVINKHRQRPPLGVPAGFGWLTLREQDIVRMIGQNLSNDEIAGIIGISPWTVHFHRKNIIRELGLHGGRLIRRCPLVPPDPTSCRTGPRRRPPCRRAG